MLDRLKNLEMRYQTFKGRVNAVEKAVTKAKKALDEAEAAYKPIEDVIKVLQAAIELRKEEMKDRVENLVTRALRAVFCREDYEFFFMIEMKSNAIGIRPRLRCMHDGKVLETSIVDGHGGGIADVVSFVLRVLVLVLSRPRMAPVLILDEPFRHVSLEYLRGCASLMKELSKTAGVQFIVITHKPELIDTADTVYKTSLRDGITEFKLEHSRRDDAFHSADPGMYEKSSNMFEDFFNKTYAAGLTVDVAKTKSLGWKLPGGMDQVRNNSIAIEDTLLSQGELDEIS